MLNMDDGTGRYSGRDPTKIRSNYITGLELQNSLLRADFPPVHRVWYRETIELCIDYCMTNGLYETKITYDRTLYYDKLYILMLTYANVRSCTMIIVRC